MQYIPAKTIVIRTKQPNPWFGTDYNMNIYKGCCHGCIYCDSRSDCYGVEDFDRVRAKENALLLIRDELIKKRIKGVVATGAMSDPYNPHEQVLMLTRGALELINAHRFGAAIATKSDLVVRDIDILTRIQTHSPVLIKMTVTTCDNDLCKKIEPGAPLSSKRLEAVKKLSDAGVYTGILLMPVLPFITDSCENILGIVRKAAQAGAKFVYPAFGMTLRSNQRAYYYRQLDRLFPGLKERYSGSFGERYNCWVPQAKELYRAFAGECRGQGLLYRMPDIIANYRAGYSPKQLSLFEA